MKSFKSQLENTMGSFTIFLNGFTAAKENIEKDKQFYNKFYGINNIICFSEEPISIDKEDGYNITRILDGANSSFLKKIRYLQSTKESVLVLHEKSKEKIKEVVTNIGQTKLKITNRDYLVKECKIDPHSVEQYLETVFPKLGSIESKEITIAKRKSMIKSQEESSPPRKSDANDM